MLDDLRTAVRRLRNAPVFTASAIVTIALALGCSAAILGIADAVLLRPLPYADPGLVFVLGLADPTTRKSAPSGPVPYEFVQAIQEHHRGITGVGMRGPQAMGPHVGTEAEWLATVAVTPTYFQVLGIRPARGRLFNERDAAEPGSAVLLSYECWQRLFGGDDRVIGRSRKVGSREREIIGVLPRGFVFPSVFVTGARFGVSGRPDYVTTALPPGPGSGRKFNSVVMPFGPVDPVVRLRDGVSRQQAQAEIDSLTRSVQPAMSMPSVRGFVPVLQEVQSVIFPMGRSIMAWLLVTAALVVLAGCTNLAVMLLARARLRESEFGVQLALGATRWRIVRPMLLETLLVGFAGSALGVAIAYSTFGVLLGQVPPEAYGGAMVGIDFRVAMIAMGVGLISGLVFGSAPAWRAVRVDVQKLLRGQTPGMTGSRRLVARPLVAAQVAGAIVLVFGSIIAGRAFVDVLRLPLGFNPAHVAVLRVDPPEDVRTIAFYRQALEFLGRRSDVSSAGAAGHLPLDGYAPDTSDENRVVGIHFVLPGYLETIGSSLLRGRMLGWDDAAEGSGSCVITQAAARALFHGADPLGRTVTMRKGRQLSIVGVVADIRQKLEGKEMPSVFALPNDERTGFVLVARMRGPSAKTLSDLRRVIGRLSPEEPLVASWWTESIDALVPFRNPRFQLIVLGTFAALALVFTALGIFAIVALVVAVRMHEIGVRLALGARPSSVVMFAARHALLPVAAGCIMGLVMTRWLASLVRAQLYAVNTDDPVTLAAAVIAVILAAVAAAYIAARTASRVDPVDPLRAS